MKAPLKTVLKNFLDHVENLEGRRILGDDQYELEFQALKYLTDKLKEDPSYSCSLGLKDVNRPKNRYKDIVPYDTSRVILPKYDGIPGSDYINASYVKGASGALAYIAAQGPLPNTVIDFWRMIWVCDVQVVVMACNEREAGKFKCEAYWPNSGEVKEYGNISIELISTAQVCSDFLVRTFLVKCESELRDVYQFHYTTWPDHGVPDSVQPILDLVRLMRDCQASETVPIVVHCSAGCGRTGTICAVDYVWACLRQGKLDEDFSLYHIALELRRQRIAMIQTKEQYILAHKAVAAMFEQQLRVIDCHIYENIDEDGEPLMWKEVHKHQELPVPVPSNKNESKDETETQYNAVKTESSIKSKNISEKTEDCLIQSLTSKDLTMKRNESSTSSGKNSESSCSRNSILSQHSIEDSIPFIDDDEVCIRPNCGRAYLDMPSCDSISKLVNCFDPFVDKLSIGTDDSSPDGDLFIVNNKMKDFHLSSTRSNERSNKPIKSVYSKSNVTDSSAGSESKYMLGNKNNSNSEDFPKHLNADTSEIDKNDDKCAKKVGKATVLRHPSISKLKSFFEKSTTRNSTDGSKRLLFRNNSQHVSRAGSAPPSLNCMDKSYAVERESILKMVTRKFRSSSVRTEREMQAKQNDKTSNRKSATCIVKDGLSTLSRTVSFNISKTFKSYSPSKPKIDLHKTGSTSSTGDDVAGTYKPKTPDSEKGNSMWYDRPSLPRAIAIVKPTGKFDVNVKPSSPKTPPPPPKPREKNKPSEQSFNYKPAKIKEYFSSLNKKEVKDSSTLWYNDSNSKESESALEIASNTNSDIAPKLKSKTLPFLPLTTWKKVNYKSPVSSPDSPKNIVEPVQANSKFYTDVLHCESSSIETTEPTNSLENSISKCPVPEEIIPLNLDTNKFWPSSSIVSEKNKTDAPDLIDCVPNKTSDTGIVVNDSLNKPKIEKDIPPAIPKKMVIGKNKIVQNAVSENEIESLPAQQVIDIKENSNTTSVPCNDEENISKISGDMYMNVNIKAIKNLEQIENTLRKNPRGAIIDLTSRESYSMEEELVNAVNQLSEKTPEENKSTSQVNEQNFPVKSNSKFPGYEVIWPEGPSNPIQKSKSSGKVLSNISTLISEDIPGYHKNGLCYSPPLRRSMNANLSLSKSQSCGNLDGIDPEFVVKENLNMPTKKLVKEAVVELNTLLNQLTSKTLSEDLDFDLRSKKSEIKSKNSDIVIVKPSEKSKNFEIQANDTVVDSVTLVTKTKNFGESPKEEEIVFHFPPPPRGPPPKDTSPVESFNIVCKNGSLVVKETVLDHNDSVTHKKTSQFPQPAPRRSKQTDELRRSASYTNISHPSQTKNNGYENVFLEKYQTLSRLEIKSELDKPNILDAPVPIQNSSAKSTSSKHYYVNVAGKHFKGYTDTKSFQVEEKFSNEKSDSTYGKIYKVAENKIQSSEPAMSLSNSFHGSIEDSKRKPLPSKKTERAPMPPQMKPDAVINSNISPKVSQSISMIPRKVPSRKLEKAPAPPLLLQKTSSDIISPKKITEIPRHHNIMASADGVHEKHKLPILRENVPNVLESSVNNREIRTSPANEKFVNRGLSHSHSDASVFLALKERKLQSDNQNQMNRNLKLLMDKRERFKNEPVNMSSSDSDSAYERIFLTKEEMANNSKIETVKDTGMPSYTSKKEMPVAPPRSKRRTTTEVQYTKVKSKEASLMVSASKNMFQENKIKNNSFVKPGDEPPPVIPLKTKDAFEIP